LKFSVKILVLFSETVKEKLANSAPVLGDLIDVTAVVPETFVVQSAADNGSQD
jgi:hypothetical protein